MNPTILLICCALSVTAGCSKPHTEMPPRCELICDGQGHYSILVDGHSRFKIDNVFTNRQDAINRAWNSGIAKDPAPDYDDYKWSTCK